MGIAVLILFYGSGIFCIIAAVSILLKYIKAPMHLHWELYKKDSVYALPDWWTKTHHTIGGKIKRIVLDVLSLREYYKRNRSFWYSVFPFHLGIYSLVVWHIWLFVFAGVGNLAEAPVWGIIWGHTSTGLVFVGAVAILAMRIFNRELRAYYPPSQYIKWAFIIIALASGFYAVFFYFNGDMSAVLEYVKKQLDFTDFSHKINAPFWTSVHLLTVVPVLLFLPFSHMMKLVLRYYHELRWDEGVNKAGSAIEKQVRKSLGRPVSWAGPHIQKGKKWSEVATTMPEKGGK